MLIQSRSFWQRIHNVKKCLFVLDEAWIETKLQCWVPAMFHVILVVQIDHAFELACILLSPVGVAILPSKTWLTVFSQEHFNSIHFSKVKNLTLWLEDSKTVGKYTNLLLESLHHVLGSPCSKSNRWFN